MKKRDVMYSIHSDNDFNKADRFWRKMLKESTIML